MKKPLYTASLILDVIAPPAELAKTGECYAMLRRKVDLIFAPFPGLVIGLDPAIGEHNKDRYSQLFNEVANKAALFVIKKINYYPERQRIRLLADSIFEPTIEQFHSVQEFLTEFYGFEKEI